MGDSIAMAEVRHTPAPDRPMKEWCRCGGLIGTRGGQAVCLSCGKHAGGALQARLDQEQQQGDAAQRALVERQEAIRQADARRAEDERRQQAALMKKYGAVLHSLSAPFDGSTLILQPSLRLPAAGGAEVKATVERYLENDWSEQFRETGTYKRVVRLQAQLSESRKQRDALQQKIRDAEAEHRGALGDGMPVDKIEVRLVSDRSKLAMVASRVEALEQLGREHEKQAREEYLAFARDKKQAGLADIRAAFEKLSLEWIGRALPGLLELVGLQEAIRSLTERAIAALVFPP